MLILETPWNFAWEDQEQGKFQEDFFLPIDIPVVPHKPWVLKNIPIPPDFILKCVELLSQK